MLMLVDALKIASIKVAQSFVNICLFRNAFSLTKLLVSGFWAFIITIYLTTKIRRVFRESYKRVRLRRATERGEKIFKFDEASFQTIDLDHDHSSLEKYSEYIERNAESDLFNCLFSNASESSLINLLTILGAEYLNSKFEVSFFLAILCSVSISFSLCFGSTFKYTRMLMADWLNDFKAIQKDCMSNNKNHSEGHSKLKKTLITHTNPIDKSVEYVGLWLSKYDSHRNASKVEIKFVTPNFTDYIKENLNYYAKHHMKLEKLKDGNENSELLHAEKNTKVEKYELYVPDYYNGTGYAKIFEKEVKELGFTYLDSWTEFRLFPGVNFNMNVYLNTEKPKKKTE